MYLHGGGWTVGTLDRFETPMRLFAERSGAQVHAVEYRLAPERRWPTQLEQAEFVVCWPHAHGAERGVDPRRIALGGDSAGGNMTCVLALKLRDRNGPRLAPQVPSYPETALPFETKGRRRTAPGCTWKPRAYRCSPGT